jgi:hypothetical protein
MVSDSRMTSIFFQAFGYYLGNSAAMVRGKILGQPRDVNALLPDDGSLIGFDLTAEQAQQGAFPITIASQQADSLPGLDLQVDLIEDFGAAKSETDPAQTDEWHTCTGCRKRA